MFHPMDRATREQVHAVCREMTSNLPAADEPLGVAVLYKMAQLKRIPRRLHDGDSFALLSGQGFLDDNVNFPTVM